MIARMGIGVNGLLQNSRAFYSSSQIGWTRVDCRYASICSWPSWTSHVRHPTAPSLAAARSKGAKRPSKRCRLKRYVSPHHFLVAPAIRRNSVQIPLLAWPERHYLSELKFAHSCHKIGKNPGMFANEPPLLALLPDLM